METLKYWNHNTAYYTWLKRRVSDCNSILDVGCGDGSLVAFLDDGEKQLVGIDTDEMCVAKARAKNASPSCQFICCDFLNYKSEASFDAIIFVASIHHMDMAPAITKAKSLLSPNGFLLIVGLAKPSAGIDYLIEGLRVLPCSIISKIRHMHSSEDENIPVSYHIPSLNEVRKTVSEELPQSSLRQGLYYRYLLVWQNHGSLVSD